MASSADYRSFGGGGNVGDAAVSGGVVRSANSTPSAQVGITVSMPSTSMYAYNNNRNPISVGDMPVVSGGLAVASASPYAGIGNTTTGRPMGINSRRNLPSISGVYLGWLGSGKWDYGSGSDSLTEQDLRALYTSITGDTDFSNPEEWEAFLAWFNSMQEDEDFKWHWLPISDAVLFLLLLCLVYMFVVYRRIKLAKKNEI
jgi:hypothetical protein